MNDTAFAELASRLDALELKAMDAELAQATLDAVVLRQSEEIIALRAALTLATQRIDALGGQSANSEGAAMSDGDGSHAASIERERPPHY